MAEKYFILRRLHNNTFKRHSKKYEMSQCIRWMSEGTYFLSKEERLFLCFRLNML